MEAQVLTSQEVLTFLRAQSITVATDSERSKKFIAQPLPISNTYFYNIYQDNVNVFGTSDLDKALDFYNKI